MKKKRLTYDSWTAITSKTYKQLEIDKEFFNGIIAILYLNSVTEPQIWEFNGDRIVVGDNNMKWLQLIPHNSYYAINTLMDKNNEIKLWYIDMIANYGFDDDNVVYFNDLYLDLIVHPDGTIKIDDMDELVEALESETITEELYNTALETSEMLQQGILKDISNLKEICKSCLYEIENE